MGIAKLSVCNTAIKFPTLLIHLLRQQNVSSLHTADLYIVHFLRIFGCLCLCDHFGVWLQVDIFRGFTFGFELEVKSYLSKDE